MYVTNWREGLLVRTVGSDQCIHKHFTKHANSYTNREDTEITTDEKAAGLTLSKDCWFRSLNSSHDFHISEKFTVGLNSEKLIKHNIKHRRNSIDGDVTTCLPNSATSTKKSLCMQLNDTHTQQFQRQGTPLKEIPIKISIRTSALNWCADNLCPQSSMYGTHYKLKLLFCLFKVYWFCLLTQLLTNKTNTEKILLFALHWAMTNRSQLYLIYFSMPYYHCTVSVFQKKIRAPYSY